MTCDRIVQEIRQAYKLRADEIWTALKRTADTQLPELVTVDELMAAFESIFNPEYSDAWSRRGLNSPSIPIDHTSLRLLENHNTCANVSASKRTT